MNDTRQPAFAQWCEIDTSCDVIPEGARAQRQAQIAPLDRLEGHDTEDIPLPLSSQENP
ncbi:hypothetical protein [Deinococcus humi]|uniref:Uncharacterized protein n=1 Tax=Deinococcus humi TaxID=662880 RepID=A0A7W8JZX1_9DEIO|nr:hypothetical protein [Deinococcus humi]MBB5365918.1 hypothetical protein [Deinococcus humi]GGO40448.1 hypothetical protein GCM10008949_49970 [Deinococcus humi]